MVSRPEWTTRRKLEKAKQLLERALSVLQNREDACLAAEDVEECHGLLEKQVLPELQAGGCSPYDRKPK